MMADPAMATELPTLTLPAWVASASASSPREAPKSVTPLPSHPSTAPLSSSSAAPLSSSSCHGPRSSRKLLSFCRSKVVSQSSGFFDACNEGTVSDPAVDLELKLLRATSDLAVSTDKQHRHHSFHHPPTTSPGTGFFARQRSSFSNSFASLIRSSSGSRTSPSSKGSKSPRNSCAPVISRVSSHSTTGLRHANGENEDQLLIECDVFANCDACDRTVALLGVFDGHGGAACAKAAVKVFPEHFRRAAAWEGLPGALPHDASTLERILVGALEEAFARTAGDFEAGAAEVDCSGACALVSAVCDGVVVTANLGDSKAIMYVKEGDKQSVRSTARHNCMNPDEVARVCAAGGHFVDNRLLGVLLPTRALGDLDFHRLAPGVLSARPQFQVVHLRPLARGDAAALLLASDGVWDFCDTAHVVAALKAGMKRQAKALATVNIAENVVGNAIRSGSDDDTSVIAVLLQ
eukprot:TRINITY_DN17598_c0_g1_i1.p1 TRINITY_DN17598_c0_g1~~TRINITY_DN17598_c0_g1_i1.p1  ORF type:complete len:464 (+),score=146.98 TRINITY_DN17598_c0_g1_i1:195-1586(+)